MSNIKLRTSAGGSVTLTPENVTGDVTLTVPGDNSTLVSAADLSASTGAGGVGYLPAGTGAVTTTVQSKLRETVSVFDFMTAAQISDVRSGAATLDVTAAIQAALDASRNVYFPPGRYRVDGELRIRKSGSSIFGAGWSTTVIYASTATTSPLFRIEDDGWAASTTYPGPRIVDINVSDMTLTGRNGSSLSDRDLVKLGGVGFESVFFRMHFDGVQRRAVVTEDLWDTSFIACKFTSCCYSNTYHHAVALGKKHLNSNAVKFLASHFEGNATGDIWLKEAANQIYITNTKFEGTNTDSAYNDFNPFLIESDCSNISFTANDVVMFQKNKAKHWLKSSGFGVSICANTFASVDDLTGACALQLTAPANVISHQVHGNVFYADGSTAEYPLDLGNFTVFSGNTVNCVNPRKLFKVSTKTLVSDNQIAGKGTVNQTGDVLCYFTASEATVSGNKVENTTTTVSNNLDLNIYEPQDNIGSVYSVANNFAPSQYRDGSFFSASAPITQIQNAYNGKSIVLKCGGANTLTHNPSNGIVLASEANFAPANWGVIALKFFPSVGWVEQSRMTWF